MKKKNILFSLLLFFPLAVLAFAGHSFAAEWTFLVYLDGDNNLEGAGIDDVNEMEMVGSTPEVNIVVQFDRIDGYDTSNGDWHDTRRGKITKDSTSLITSNLTSIGEKNMGAPQTLAEFVAWGLAAFPANYYFLVLWNHGDGWYTHVNQLQTALALVNERISQEGPSLQLQQEASTLSKKVFEARKAVCWDDTDGGDALTMKECREALEGINKQINIIGFDACLMAMIEVAHEIKDVADIMIASQHLEPDDGWPYDLFLAELISSPSMSPTFLSRKVVSSYGYSYGGEETQSAILLSKISDLSSTIDTLASTLLSETTDWETIQEARSGASAFYEPNYRDLQGFLDGLIASVDNEASRNVAIQTRAALIDSVIENHGGPNEGANGLSIQLGDLGERFPYGYDESNLLFAEVTQWDEFLTMLSQQQPPDDEYEENDTINESQLLAMGTHQSLRCQDDDWFKVVVPPNTSVMATISFNHSAGDLDLELYDHTLDLTDESNSVSDTESVFAKAEASQGYYIHVYGYSGATNRYDLTVASPASDNFYACEVVPYEWIDATDGIYLEMGDDDYTSVGIGFPFQFYGITYSGLKISSNGYLTFGYVGDEYVNQPIPMPGEPSNLVAPFWDDLVPSNGNGVFYKLTGAAPNRRFVVQWDNVPHYVTTKGITFEAILDEGTHEIVFQYHDVSFDDPQYDNGKSATVGVENSSGSLGTLYSYKESSVSPQYALRFFVLQAHLNIHEISIEPKRSFLPNNALQLVTTATTNQGNPLYYRYWVAPGYGTTAYGPVWNMVKDLDADNSCIWSPANEDHYLAVVQVTDDISLPTAKHLMAGVTVPVGASNNNSPHITSLRADVSYPHPVSEEITFTAEATGGLVPCFQYWVSRNENQIKSWNMIQDFSPNGACRWIPEEAGRYVVVVHVSESPGIEGDSPELAGLTLVIE